MSQAQTAEAARFRTFTEFFPFYLGEHANPLNRALHMLGTTLAVGTLVYALATSRYSLIALAPVLGYGFAWTGHFFVEKNKPASFKYPLWSFLGDFKMYYYMVSGKI